MKGTVWQRGKTWTYAFSIEQGGKRRQISKGGYRTKKLAGEALNEPSSTTSEAIGLSPPS